MYTKHTVRISLLILAMKGWRMNTCRWYFVHWLIWEFTTVLCDRRQCPVLFMCPSFCMQIKDGCYICDCGSMSGYLQKASNELSRLSAQQTVQTGTQIGSFGPQAGNIHSGNSGIESHHENGPGTLQTYSYQPFYNSGYGRLFAQYDGMIQSGQRPTYQHSHPLYSGSEQHHLFMPGMGCGYVKSDCPSVCLQTDIYTGCITCSCDTDRKSTTLEKTASTQPTIASTIVRTTSKDAYSSPQIPVYDSTFRTPSTPYPRETSQVISNLKRTSTRYPHVTAEEKPMFKTASTLVPRVAAKETPPLKVPSTPHPHTTPNLTPPLNVRATPSQENATRLAFNIQLEPYLHATTKETPPLKVPTPRLTKSQAITFSVSSIQRSIRTPTTPSISPKRFTKNLASTSSEMFKWEPTPLSAFKQHLLQTTRQPMSQTSQRPAMGQKQFYETGNATEQILGQYNKQENTNLDKTLNKGTATNRSFAQVTTKPVTTYSQNTSVVHKKKQITVQPLGYQSGLFDDLPGKVEAYYKNYTDIQLKIHSNINSDSRSMDSTSSINKTAVSATAGQLPGISELGFDRDQSENTKNKPEHVIGLFGNVKSGINNVSRVWDPNSAFSGGVDWPDRHTYTSNI